MRRILFCLAIGLALPAQAEWGRFEYDFDEDKTPWQEVQAQLPVYPKQENLVPVAVSSATSNRFFVDRASVSVGEDHVVRYTVVVRSPSGAQTVNFEGMRCDTGERKIYAFGREGREWSRNRHARWEPIQARQQTGYHRELFFHYFCAGGEGAPSLDRILYRLKTGGYYPQY